MPVGRSAKKKLRKDKKRTKKNLLRKKATALSLKKFKTAPTLKSLAQVFRELDFAKKKKLFHPNKVARLKARMAKFFQEKTKQK